MPNNFNFGAVLSFKLAMGELKKGPQHWSVYTYV